ncbi:MAG: arsenate reductase ArsC [Gammaproteobacteria bacterium]|nr:arsenate reductase ArsC [Gammaproteobacteria bacterium]
MAYPLRVLFLCTGNSCRSQMAEALLRHFGGEDFAVYSAGTDPKPIHPLTRQIMAEIDLDLSNHRSKDLQEFLGQSFDYVITVCDRARDNCPTFPGDNERIHWGFEDPAAAPGDVNAQRLIFRRVRNEINERVRVWVTVQRKLLKQADRTE